MSTVDKLGNIAELKRQALDYFVTNPEITKKVEDALNDLFYTEPEDVYGYLVGFVFMTVSSFRRLTSDNPGFSQGRLFQRVFKLPGDNENRSIRRDLLRLQVAVGAQLARLLQGKEYCQGSLAP
jgi:hypothetical protein